MHRMPADYSDALSGIDQEMLDSVSELGDMRTMSRAAFLKIGAMHGVTVEIEPPLSVEGDVPPLVRQGLVIRCLLPKGLTVAQLGEALSAGPVARLVQRILDGHRVSLEAEGGTGGLSRAAELARARLLETLSGMAPAPLSPAPLARLTDSPARRWQTVSPLHLAA